MSPLPSPLLIHQQPRFKIVGITKAPFLLHNSAFYSLLSSHNKTHLFTLNPISITFPSLHRTHHNVENHSRIFSIKKGSKEDDPLDLFEEVEDEEDEYGVDDKPDGVFVFPLGKMKEWYDNKPRGFGEGKVYDTSTEDKLFDEMQQSRLALANSISNGKVAAQSKEIKQIKKVPETVSSGIRVRLTNLPKKKNVHRDLKYAFKEVPGIINIIPAVSGNKKTRDPVCKGFAFVEFKSQKDATKFVKMFSEQSIAFGKVQKMITCEMVNSQSPESVLKEAADVIYTVPEVVSDESEETYDEPDVWKMETTDISESDNSSFEFWAEDNDTEDIKNSELDGSSLQLMVEGTKRLMENVSAQNGDGVVSEADFQRILMSLNPIEEVEKKEVSKGKVPKKKQRVKGKGKKLEVPGSAKRLKVREKAMLTDVFSKYGAKPVSATTEAD